MALTKEENKNQRSSNNDGSKSQLSSHPTGARNFSTPDDIAAGGGSRIYDSDFGTLAQSDRRDRERAQLNRQRHMTMKKEHAVRVGYRRAIKKKDGAGALALLNSAENAGLNPFGLRAQGERNKAAYDAIASKQASEIRGGRRKYEPDKNYFQQSLAPSAGKPEGATPSGTAETTPEGTAPIPTLAELKDVAGDNQDMFGTEPAAPTLEELEDVAGDNQDMFGTEPALSSFVKSNNSDRSDSDNVPKGGNNLLKALGDSKEMLRVLSGLTDEDTRSDIANYFKLIGPDLYDILSNARK